MRLIAFVMSFVLFSFASPALAMPTPILHFDGTEVYTAGGTTWVRYKLRVVNWASFPAALFTPAPALPPCGANPNSARAWVDIHNGITPYARIYGFCALGAPSDLRSLWFAVERGHRPPALVFIKIRDRRTGEVRASARIAPH